MAKGNETVRLSDARVSPAAGRGAAPAFTLVVYHREGAEVVPLARGVPVVVGRAAPAHVTIPDPSLSRQHARFTLEGEGILVEDLGSTNGTLEGGARIDRSVLRAGDDVLLGNVVAAVHALTVAERDRPQGLEGHDRFRFLLEAEVTRARFFGRAATVLVVRAGVRPSAHVSRWAARVAGCMRPVDVAALYSDAALEVLLPEMDEAGALAIARALVTDGAEPPLVCGVATFPNAAGSAEQLLEVSRDAALRATVKDAFVAAAPRTRRTWTSAEPGEDEQPICDSATMRAAMQTAKRVARGVIPCLLQGETGTGKEVLARFIHETGPRRDKPMVSVNCAAIPAQLVESTLFGHEKGSFTGATQSQKGVFESAEGGTVLLDEIGELPVAAQAALLRVLETKGLCRVGSTREIKLDVRIVAATHRDLEAMAEQGTFRQDLFYRLNALAIRIPPLRDRKDDIPKLAARFLRKANEANERRIAGIDDDAMSLLVSYDWPGNIRELRNAIDRAVVIAEGDLLTSDDLPERVRVREPLAAVAPPRSLPPTEPAREEDGSQEDFRTQMDRLEARVIVTALRSAGWNQSEAARRLRIPLRTLVYKIREHGIKKLGYGVQ